MPEIPPVTADQRTTPGALEASYGAIEPGDDLAHQDEWAAELEELPVRPRRRLATPLNAVLLGLLLLACGFIGGVLVEKGQNSSSTAGGNGFARRFAAAGAGAGAAGGTASGRPGAGASDANATIGTVADERGHTLYVTDSQGNTIAVHAVSGAKVTRTSTSRVSSIRPGDTIIATGARASNGALAATSIRSTASNAATGGGLAALFGAAGRFGASGAGGAGAASGGTGSAPGAGASSGGSGASGGKQALFGPG